MTRPISRPAIDAGRVRGRAVTAVRFLSVILLTAAAGCRNVHPPRPSQNARLAVPQTASLPSAPSWYYRVMDLGPAPQQGAGAEAHHYPLRINARGQVPLTRLRPDGSEEAALWSADRVTPLPLDGTGAWQPLAINDAGDVVGLRAVGDQVRAVLWRHGRGEDVTPPGGRSAVDAALNNRGQVVVTVEVRSSITRAFLWDRGRWTDLGTLGPGSTGASDLNDQGQVCGWSEKETGLTRAFVWSAGTMRELGDLGNPETDARAINRSGDGVGRAYLDPPSGTPPELYTLLAHPVLYREGRAIDLGTLPGFLYGEAQALNSRGEVVGLLGRAGVNGARASNRAFHWQAGQMVDLNTRIPPGSGWVLLDATGINDRGQIVGYGIYRNALHRYLLNPRGRDGGSSTSP